MPNKFSLLLGIVLLGQIGCAQAEKADRDKPIQIDSDRMSLDNGSHVSIFEGKVELTQGTLRVLAEKIVVTEDEAGHKFCVATGHLASFRQKRDLVNEYVEGYGERIEYNTLSEKIDLFVRARVKREHDDVRGDHITYNMQTETFRVNSPEKTGRVRATLQPQNKDTKTPAKDANPKAAETKADETKIMAPKVEQPNGSGSSAAEPKLPTPVTPEMKLTVPITSEPSPAGNAKQPGN